jgi:proline dehydrogenase
MESKPNNLSFTNTQIAYDHYSNSQLKKAYGVYKLIGNKFLTSIGTTLTQLAFAFHVPIKPFVKFLIFDQFCGGETLKESTIKINTLAERKVGVNLNYGVEIKNSESDFENTLSKTKEAIAFAGKHKNVQVISCKVSGIGYFSILEKKQAGETLSKDEQQSFAKMVKRMDTICAYASQHEVAIYWDAEESWVQDEIDILVDEFMAKYNKEKAIIFNTYQLYRKDKLVHLKDAFELANKNAYYLGAKLVRGAYIEKENEWALENNKETVIHSNKKAVDKDFNDSLKFCLENIEKISVCIASHNEESNLLAAQLMKNLGLASNHPHVSFSQLYGMGDFITFNLAKQDYNAVKYMPFGPVKEVIPYLIRRAQENSSVDGQMSRELSMLQKELKRRAL